MPNIKMPNGDIVAFPDDMPKEQIRGLIAKKFPDAGKAREPGMVDTAVDVGKAVASRGAKGLVLDTAMVLPNLLNEAVAGPQYLYKGISDTFAGRPTDKSFEPYRPFYSSADVAQEVGLDYEAKTNAGRIAGTVAEVGGNLAGPSAFNKAANTKLAKSDGSGRQKLVETTADDLAKMGSEAYAAAGKAGSEMPATVLDDFVDEASKIGFKSQKAADITGQGEYSRIASKIPEWKGTGKLTFDDMDEIDKALTEAISSEFVKAKGVTPDVSKMQKLQTAFRDSIDKVEVSGKLKEARNLWSSQARLRDIEAIVERASMMDNPSRGIQTGFRQLAFDKARLRGYTPEEIKLIKKAAKSGIATDILRTVGSRLMPIVSMATGNVQGAAIGGAGATMAREGATAIQTGQANKVAQSVINRATAKSKPSIQDWAKKNAAGAAKASVIQPDAFQAEEEAYTPSQPVNRERAPLDIEPQANSDIFDKIKQAESSGNPKAKNPNSSASGLFQFTDQTWKDSVKKWGKKHGITMDMKNEPWAQETLVRELAKDNARILVNKLGNEPTKADMYVAHFMGAPQAVKLIKNKNSKMIAAKVFPKEAKANKPIFYNNGKPRTIAEVYNVLARKVQDG